MRRTVKWVGKIGLLFYLSLFFSGFLPQKYPARLIIVMENYPPESYLEEIPAEMDLSYFREKVLSRLTDQDEMKLVRNAYYFQNDSRKMILKYSIEEEDLIRLKNILVSINILKPMGIEIEVTREIFSQMGIEAVYKEYPWSRCIDMMKKGSADAIVTIFRNTERDKFLLYPKNFLAMEVNSLFALKSSDIKYTGRLESLNKYVIGVKANTSYGEKFDNCTSLKKSPTAFTENIISMVEHKRVDLGVGPVLLISHLSKTLGAFEKIKFLEPVLSKDPLYIAFAKKNTYKQLTQDFSVRLAEFKKTRKYKAILDKYGYKEN